MIKECDDILTVIETVYHRPHMKETYSVDNRFSRKLTSEEQPYIRRHDKESSSASEELELLDFGWLSDNVGMVVISNDEGKEYEVHPSEDEIKDTEKRIIEISYGKSDLVWYIPPGESFRGSPSNASQLSIRCQHGKAKYTLTVFPK